MKNEDKKINVGIGFVTGRRSFKNVVTSYIEEWKNSEMINKEKYSLHLLVSYDLNFTNTELNDFQINDEEILNTIDSAYYLSQNLIMQETQELIEKNILTSKETRLIFGEGYAMKRNAVLYFAIKNRMDYLIFLDDDEYPIANLKTDNGVVWQGQSVIENHIKNLKCADITHGLHCGYVSPIPQFNFNNKLTEDDFKEFILAVSNDIINWESIKSKMDDGGITYADPHVIKKDACIEVLKANGMKFISGANLGINLKNLSKVYPFYNPPGARGEDTFLSTCISECNVMSIPCYTFHDGFSSYQSLTNGVLPRQLKSMNIKSSNIAKRFLKASVGWIRYKPLLVYITQREEYEQIMKDMEQKLLNIVPKFCRYFGNDVFRCIENEFYTYLSNVQNHYKDFEHTKLAWEKIMKYIKSQK